MYIYIPELGGRKIRRAENMEAINEIACATSSWIHSSNHTLRGQ